MLFRLALAVLLFFVVSCQCSNSEGEQSASRVPVEEASGRFVNWNLFQMIWDLFDDESDETELENALIVCTNCTVKVDGQMNAPMKLPVVELPTVTTRPVKTKTTVKPLEKPIVDDLSNLTTDLKEEEVVDEDEEAE